MKMPSVDRRNLLRNVAAVAGTAALTGCDRLSSMPWFRRTLQLGEDANLYVQRLLLTPGQLAPEYADADISAAFKPNGSTNPTDKTYHAMARRGFSDYRLVIDGLVEKPTKLSIAELRKMSVRTQITRHDCVEGWTCIGKWTGVPLSELLQHVGLKPQARYIVFHCADVMEGPGSEGSESDDGEAGGSGGTKENMSQQQGGGGSKQVGQSAKSGAGDSKKGQGGKDQNAKGGGDTKQADASSDDADDDTESKPVYFYGSIDLADAYHPQTILAYEMNGKPLPVPYGAPLRLRVERQLGYKMSKYVMRIEVVDDFSKIGDGHGGYWEDRGYDWYAGI